MRPDHNDWLIDGGEAYDRGSGGKFDLMPSMDALAEFQTLSSNYSPDYGISSGGTVTMVLKSGTKQFHGGVWEFNRNDAFDADYYFSKQVGHAHSRTSPQYLRRRHRRPGLHPRHLSQEPQQDILLRERRVAPLCHRRQSFSHQHRARCRFPDRRLSLSPISRGTKSVRPACRPAFAMPACPLLACPRPAILPSSLSTQRMGLTPGNPFPSNVIPANLLDPNAVLFMGTGAHSQAQRRNRRQPAVHRVSQAAHLCSRRRSPHRSRHQLAKCT